jgi:hypothetical protein
MLLRDRDAGRVRDLVADWTLAQATVAGAPP